MTADKYGVERKSIRNWREKKTVAGVTKMSYKSIKSTLHMEEKQKLMKQKMK